MTQEQKNNLEAALEAENSVVLIEVSEDMLSVMTELGIDISDATKMAISAFESVMRGKVQASIDRAIKAKYLADCKGKTALSSELEQEIQKGILLKKLIS